MRRETESGCPDQRAFVPVDYSPCLGDDCCLDYLFHRSEGKGLLIFYFYLQCFSPPPGRLFSSCAFKVQSADHDTVALILPSQSAGPGSSNSHHVRADQNVLGEGARCEAGLPGCRLFPSLQHVTSGTQSCSSEERDGCCGSSL